jgi:hypothetical protein
MEYLTPDEVRANSVEITVAFADLMATRSLVVRPDARQWRFFEACAAPLLGVAAAGTVPPASSSEAAQLKFEVEDRLRRFFNQPGRPVSWVFRLVHARDLGVLDLPISYPAHQGYCLLVRKLEETTTDTPSASELRAYLEKVIQEANDAEFRAYRRLPEIDEAELLRCFDPAGPACLEIGDRLARLKGRGWVLTNPRNPSTWRLMKVSIGELTADEAQVRTVEYWYLRWWDSQAGKYTYPYRETNRQTYVLRRTGEEWTVYQNLRPAPRSSAPHRRVKR